MDEPDRIRKAYAERKNPKQGNIYSYHNPSALFIYQEREKAILKTLSENGLEVLTDKKILDLGCGYGGILRDFINYGALPKNCYGIDLLPERIDKAKELSPGMSFKCQNAVDTGFDDEYFDVIICSTVFSSILDKEMKRDIAREILRILSPEGIVLWYDYHTDNPRNKDVKGVTKKEIEELFIGSDIRLKRITLAPPIVRALAPYSIFLCFILEKLLILNTHYIGAIKKFNH